MAPRIRENALAVTWRTRDEKVSTTNVDETRADSERCDGQPCAPTIRNACAIASSATAHSWRPLRRHP